MIIREAVVSDAPQIALLGRITFNETFGHLFEDRGVLVNYFEKTFSVEKIRTSIQKENSVFWIAFVSLCATSIASSSVFICGIWT